MDVNKAQRGVSDSMLGELGAEARTTITFYPKGSTLCAEGHQPPGVLVMYDGLAELSIAGAKGKSVFLGIATPGEILGLSETISGKPYELTAVAIRPCQVALVERDEFLRFLGEHSQACFQLLQRLGKNLNLVYERARCF